MRIELLTQDQYDEILALYKAFPELTLENNGYEYINRREFTDEAKEADKKVSDILKANIYGFQSFSNFCHDKDGNIRIRIQYNWGAEDNSMPFTGVGYCLLTELLNGFNEVSV